MSHHYRYAAALAAALALLTGCSGHGDVPDLVSAGSLAPGSCQQAAGSINVVHRQVAGIRADSAKATAARSALAKASTDLRAIGGNDADPVSARTSDLVQAVGFLRVGIDSHSYDKSVLSRADDAARSLAAACRRS